MLSSFRMKTRVLDMKLSCAQFKDAGIHSKKMLFGVNVIMGSAKSFFVLLSALFLDRFGRRPLLLLGSAGMALSLSFDFFQCYFFF